MDQSEEDNKVEPPAGLQFTNIIPSSFSIVDKSKCSGYAVLETAPAQEEYTRIEKRKRCSHSKRHYYSTELTAKKLRILSNSGVAEELQTFFGKYPRARDYVNLVDNKKRSALHFASSRGNDGLVHLLLQQGADPNIQDLNGNTPLHLAACTHHIRVITLLLRYGADVKKADIGGKTPLNLSLSRLRMLSRTHKSADNKFSSYTLEKRKAEVLEIISMLTEYFEKCGQKQDSFKMIDMKTQLLAVQTDEGVEEVNNLLSSFTEMTINAAAKANSPEQ